MKRTLIFAIAALAGCSPRDNPGQDFKALMPACVIACRSGIEAVNAQPDSIINMSPRPVAAPR